MSITDRLQEIRTGFHRSFWVANGMELFERLAYYGQGAILSVFLRDHIGLTPIEVGTLSSIFGGLIYFLPILAGTLADRFGFRKAFAVAFFVLAVGYFLVGSTGMREFAGVYGSVSKFWVLVPIMAFTALGGAFIKPSVLGTVSVGSSPATKSVGYAIYYWIVNIGAAAGPFIANAVRRTEGIEYVYLVSAISCALMFVVNLAMYRNVPGAQTGVVESVWKKLANMFVVLVNVRFMIFLVIFSLYWIMFWAGLFMIVPWYVTDFIGKDAAYEPVIAVGALTIILLQLLVNHLTKGIAVRNAIVIGFAISSLCWLIIGLHPTIPIMVAGIAVWSIGEMIQAPRYYEHISNMAPAGQQALFQGYAFLPIAIAWAIGGPSGGWLYTAAAKESSNPAMVWYALAGIGAVATVLMWVYNMVLAPSEREGKAV